MATLFSLKAMRAHFTWSEVLHLKVEPGVTLLSRYPLRDDKSWKMIGHANHHTQQQ